MKKLLLLITLVICASFGAHAQTIQCQTTSGAWGPCPLNASVQLFTTVAATGTATATAQKVYNFSMTGTLIATYASITGSPATCTFQVKSGDSLGNLINNASAVSTTPANGTTSTVFIPATTQQTADEISVVYACGTYPTAGTLSLEFVPNTNGANSATTPWFAEPSDGTNAMGTMANFGTSPGAVKGLNVNASLFSGTTALGTPNTFGTTAPTGNALGVNASIFSGTTALGTPNTFGTTAPTGAALGVNASLFMGTTLATAATFGTTASGTGALVNASLFCATTVCATAASGVQKVGIVGGAGTSLETTAGVLDHNLKNVGNSAVVTAATGVQMVGLEDGSGNKYLADPCAQIAGSSALINLTASGQVITGTASKQTYICSIDVVTATAQNIALVEGTGTTCATSIAGMAGGTTAATGWNFAANSGLVKGVGSNWVYKTATLADNVCLLLSSTGQTSGEIRYVQQ
jgi:hypothetical protein